MFLNAIKSLLFKKKLKKTLCNVVGESLDSPVARVGLIIDESHFLNTSALKQEIISNGISEENIKIIAYRDHLKKNEIHLEHTFTLKDVNLKSQFSNEELNNFISDEFDLLINYYNEENPFLQLLTNQSKAKFKAGFAAVDKRLNHLLINTALENYKGFTQELFRYLKILNKI